MLSFSVFFSGFIMFFLLFILLFYSLKFYVSSIFLFVEWEIINLGGFSLVLLAFLDWMGLVFMFVVFFISLLVLFYSYNYMTSSSQFLGFFLLKIMFVFSMVLLVLSPNLISLMLGWDGLGLVSYCLIMFYDNMKSSNSSMLTVLSNRVGDLLLLLSISWLVNYGSCSFFFLEFLFKDIGLLYVFMMITVGSMTKSAQIPFSAWLPAAMAAPTPVSSLVHSSTLVTAGVFLLMRFSFMLDFSIILFYFSLLTLFMSGSMALFEMDLKKVVALSTLSQIGVMMLSLSLGLYELCFFHLLTHAVFKSLLFLCSGDFIHNSLGFQDIRSLDNLSSGSYLVCFFFYSSSFSLCGWPFMAGFYSKDLLLESFFFNSFGFYYLVLLVVGMMFTLLYSLRLSFYLFFFNKSSMSYSYSFDSYKVYLALVFLFFFSVISGSLMVSSFFPLNFSFMGYFFKFLFIFYMASYMGLIFYLYNKFLSSQFMSLFYFLKFMIGVYYFSVVYSVGLVKFCFGWMKWLDQGWGELLGGKGVLGQLEESGYYLDKFNFILFSVLLGLFSVIFYFFILFF